MEETGTKLGSMGIWRRVETLETDRRVLKEEAAPYNAVFDPKSELLNPENGYFLDYNAMESTS